MVFVSTHGVWHSSTVIFNIWDANGQLHIIRPPMCFSNFSLGFGVYHSWGPGLLLELLTESSSELLALGEFGYDTLSSMVPGLAPSMSTVLTVKVIPYKTGDCRTLESTFLSPGCQSKLSVGVLRWITEQVRRAVPPPSPWVFSRCWCLKAAGNEQQEQNSAGGPAWVKWIKHFT